MADLIRHAFPALITFYILLIAFTNTFTFILSPALLQTFFSTEINFSPCIVYHFTPYITQSAFALYIGCFVPLRIIVSTAQSLHLYLYKRISKFNKSGGKTAAELLTHLIFDDVTALVRPGQYDVTHCVI